MFQITFTQLIFLCINIISSRGIQASVVREEESAYGHRQGEDNFFQESQHEVGKRTLGLNGGLGLVPLWEWLL